MAYQSFGDARGDSRSADKLSRLGLPEDLNGKSVLDLGCNEGFFSFEAKRRGAAYVLGLDHDVRVVNSGKARSAEFGLEVEFQQGDMYNVPNRKFDYVFLLSALHYIDEPAHLLARIKQVLNPGGVLILEIGVAKSLHGPTIARALRSIDERYFATSELLKKVWLRGYAVQEHGPSVAQAGDPIPRFVFHCTPAKTNVIIVTGDGGIRSHAARQQDSFPLISTDVLFAPMRSERPKGAVEQKLYDDACAEMKSVHAAWDKVGKEAKVQKYFASTIANAVRQCAGLGTVVVEGHVATTLVQEIQLALGEAYHCWATDKIDFEPRSARP